MEIDKKQIYILIRNMARAMAKELIDKKNEEVNWKIAKRLIRLAGDYDKILLGKKTTTTEWKVLVRKSGFETIEKATDAAENNNTVVGKPNLEVNHLSDIFNIYMTLEMKKLQNSKPLKSLIACAMRKVRYFNPD